MDNPLTDSEIVALLRSDDAASRAKGLAALYPAIGDVVLTHVEGGRLRISSPTRMNAGQTFAALLIAASHVGTEMGMILHWVQNPAHRGLVVPQMRMMK